MGMEDAMNNARKSDRGIVSLWWWCNGTAAAAVVVVVGATTEAVVVTVCGTCIGVPANCCDDDVDVDDAMMKLGQGNSGKDATEVESGNCRMLRGCCCCCCG